MNGPIPPTIGQLKSLDVLDLSQNLLFGEIPTSLSQINRLSALDPSNNNLFGKIPSDTHLQSFNASTYKRNPRLCGAPLVKKQSRDEEEIPPSLSKTKFKKMEMIYGFMSALLLDLS